MKIERIFRANCSDWDYSFEEEEDNAHDGWLLKDIEEEIEDEGWDADDN